jgi:glycosyltransferase involved in cell wall biosynthesis
VHFVFTTLGYHPENIGGAFRYVTEIAEGLARRGHRVEVVYPSIIEADSPRATEHRNGVILHRFRVPRASFWRNWFDRNRALRDILRTIRRDDPYCFIISCHGYFANAVTCVGGDIISLFTGPWAEEFLQSRTLASRPFLREKLIAPALRKVEKSGLQHSRFILTISQYYLRHLPQWHPEISRPIHVIEGGVNLEQFRPPPDRDKVRSRLGLSSDDFLFLAVRRLETRMGLLELVDAFAKVAAEFPKARLWIGGTGSQREALEERIHSHSLTNRARLLGFIPEADLASHYAAADCVIMPSIDLEGFGLATVEALACGAPVLGSRHGATPEILEPLDASLLYAAPADLEKKLRGVLAQPEALPSRARCRAYAEERYSWERPIAAFERFCLGAPEAKR